MNKPVSAERFWDREVTEPTHTSWMEHPRILQYVLSSISGTESGLWPMDWFMRWVGGRRFRHALSVGCGTGPLERDVIRKELVERIDAFDQSTTSLRIAREQAASEGVLSRIHYFAADFNRPALPRRKYDIVFVHQALHHVKRLEHLLSALMNAMTEDALLYVDEYIGPSRTDWTDRLIAPHRAVFAALPENARRWPEIPLPIQVYDETEAVRSSEIIDRVQIGFDIEAFRGYGGNLLSVIYPAADFTSAPEALESLIAEEQRRLAGGEPPYYALFIARPKTGRAARRAAVLYTILHPISRIRRLLHPPTLKALIRQTLKRFLRKALRLD